MSKETREENKVRKSKRIKKRRKNVQVKIALGREREDSDM